MSKSLTEIQQIINARKFKVALVRSHRLQSQGVDYQEAAAVAAAENGVDPLGDDYEFLKLSNGPGCECEFCKLEYKDCERDPYDSGDYDC